MNESEINSEEENLIIPTEIPLDHKNYLPDVEVQPVRDAANAIKMEFSNVLVGQHDLVTYMLTGMFAGGHMLIEGVPGIAKTLSAKILAKCLDLDYSRIQFTPDLMPSDITGTSIFNLKTSEFTFNKGPIFSNVVLIDEINRAPAKTQAALFEVMEEQQISVDGITYQLENPFLVLATQNPIEQEGTYRLPEAQLDRFLFRIQITYPHLEDEKTILKRFSNDFKNSKLNEIAKILDPTKIAHIKSLVEKVFIKDELIDYIAAIVVQTRNDSDLFLGASPRASLAILKSSKAYAAINGRSFVTPDDIKFVAYPVLNHRVQVMPEKEMEGVDTFKVIKRIIESIEVPR